MLYRKILLTQNWNMSKDYLSWQVSVDLFIFTFFLLISGGANNPLYALFYVIAIVGGILTVGGSGLFFSLLLLCVFLVQIQPIFVTTYAWDIIFSYQTFPFLGVQITVPAATYLIARSFGELLDRSQKQLLQATVQNERLDRLRALGALSAGLSHEFASPLHTAQLRLKRAQRLSNDDQADLKECGLALAECESVLRRMNSSLIDFNETDLEYVDVKELVEKIAQQWNEDFRDISFTMNLTPATIKVHRLNLTQAVINLLDNAAEAMNLKGKITIHLAQKNHKTELTFEDEGPGFLKNILKHLGEPFNTSKETGTGLGLYSTSLLMHAMSGNMIVANNENKGAQITLVFPEEIES